MTVPIWIGVDVGTTGVRAVAYQPDGQCLGSSSREYALYTPHPGWAEQDPDELIGATEQVLRLLTAELSQHGHKPDGVAFSSVFHSFLAYDKAFHPLTRLMSWADSRSQDIVTQMKASDLEFLPIYRRTGCPLHPMYPMAKVAWLAKERPDIAKQSPFLGSIKDYIFWSLTGRWVVDRSIASGTGLYNLFNLEWDKELLQLLKISESVLPEVVPTTYSQPITAEAAERTGLPVGIAVVIGAGDGVLVNVGIGAVRPGDMSCTIGTSGAVRILSDKPRTDEKGRTWCYNLTDKTWVLGGAINNGGISLRWIRDNFGEAEQKVAEKMGLDPYELLIMYASKVAPGSDGLILLPFFLGERAPSWNADARGVLFGLTLNHGKHHLIRATMEGVCYRMNSILRVLEEVTGPAQHIRVSGSFTRSELWLQILADVFDQDVNVPTISEGAAFGAAVLGFISAGVLDDIADTGNFVTVAKSYAPIPEARDRYKQLFAIYERVYWNLQKEFIDISAYQNG
jgi:gluconokinase